MTTPHTTIRFTASDRRTIAMIKHLAGYMTDAKAIREALRDKLEALQNGKKGSDQ